MIIAVCDPKGIAIEAIKTILYHDKGLSDRISRIYEFWNMEQLLDASRDSSFDCIVFPNYCNSHNSVVCSLSCGYNRFPLVEHDPRYTLIVRDILYWETARSLWTQYLKAIPGKEEKVKRAIRGILADYEKEERDIIYLESKNHCVLVHLDGIRQTPEGSPSFYATLDEAEHEFASSAFLRIHKSYLINGDHTWNIHGRKQIVWRCVNRLEYGTKFCSHSPSIPEEELHQAILKAVQNLAANFTDEVAAQLDGILRQMKAGENLKAQLQKQLEKAQQEFDRLLEMSLELDESTPFLDDKLRKLSGKIKILKANIAESTDGKGEDEEATKQLTAQDLLIKEYDDILTARIIEKVIVHSRQEIEIYFIGGYTQKIDLI